MQECSFLPCPYSNHLFSLCTSQKMTAEDHKLCQVVTQNAIAVPNVVPFHTLDTQYKEMIDAFFPVGLCIKTTGSCLLSASRARYRPTLPGSRITSYSGQYSPSSLLSMASDQEIHITTNRVHQFSLAHGNHLFYNIYHPFEANDLVRQFNFTLCVAKMDT